MITQETVPNPEALSSRARAFAREVARVSVQSDATYLRTCYVRRFEKDGANG